MEVKSIDEVNKLYSTVDVTLEECILESSQIYYSICKIAKLDVYDVVLICKDDNRLINFESRKALSGSTLRYFNMYKGDVYEDNHGNTFECTSHYILY